MHADTRTHAHAHTHSHTHTNAHTHRQAYTRTRTHTHTKQKWTNVRSCHFWSCPPSQCWGPPCATSGELLKSGQALKLALTMPSSTLQSHLCLSWVQHSQWSFPSPAWARFSVYYFTWAWVEYQVEKKSFFSSPVVADGTQTWDLAIDFHSNAQLYCVAINFAY